jgi:uncharacterized protein
MDTLLVTFSFAQIDLGLDVFQILSHGLALACGGLLVGWIVGLTGVGGGSLMTPLLILMFGIQPHLAIGTDLLFAAVTKCGALPNLVRQRRIDWPIVAFLALGSLPASWLTMQLMRKLGPASDAWRSLSCHLLGVMLVLTAASMLFKVWRTRADAKPSTPGIDTFESIFYLTSEKSKQTLTNGRVLACVGLGLVLGAMVTLTSVGAGAIGTAVLIALFGAMPLARIVGNDIAHAIPLTLVAGLGHAALGAVDWTMLAWLLLGSLPGIWLGTRSYGRFPERWLRGGLSLLLAYAGLRLAFV